MNELLSKKIGSLEGSHKEDLLNQLLEIEVLLEVIDLPQSKLSICVLTDEEEFEMTNKVFMNLSNNIQMFTLSSLDFDNENEVQEKLIDFDYIVLFKNHFSPSIFHEINKYCIQLDKKLIISYLDGNEGVIVPLVNYKQVGCYNDFEILRESSFYNLLDYQVMKEQLFDQEHRHNDTNPLHFNMLVHQTALLLNHYSSYTTINYFAYSIDFERMVNTKTRLLKFPKCPSCQSDKNLVHAFI